MNCDIFSYICILMNMICYNDDMLQVGKNNVLKIIYVLFMVF